MKKFIAILLLSIYIWIVIIVGLLPLTGIMALSIYLYGHIGWWCILPAMFMIIFLIVFICATEMEYVEKWQNFIEEIWDWIIDFGGL